MGTDKVVVGAYMDDAGATNAGSAYIFNTNGVLLATITNPAPAANDYFGSSVAAVGADKVVVGADKVVVGAYQDDAGAVNAGSAYIFNTAGVLLATITNPAPTVQDNFGYSVAGLGTDKVVVGAYNDDAGAADAGSVYIFNTAGVLLATITNPAPAAGDYFGRSVAGVGTDKVVVGASYDDAGATDAGSAYLFDLSAGGALIRNTATLESSSPTDSNTPNNTGTVTVATGAKADLSVTKTGASSVLPVLATNTYVITVTNNGPDAATVVQVRDALPTNLCFLSATPSAGSYDSSAHSWDINRLDSGQGATLTMVARVIEAWNPSLNITNPAPAASDFFGYSVAAVGTDKVVVGAYMDDAGATNAGSAYIFNTNGVLLATITNPAPAANDYFGYSVAAVGTDKVVVGAYNDDAGATNAGSAYIFDVNGVLLTTITNPAPAVNDYFGTSVAGLGTDKVVVSATYDDAGATDAGSAYIFDVNGVLLATITNPAPAVCIIAASLIHFNIALILFGILGVLQGVCRGYEKGLHTGNNGGKICAPVAI